jgi:hypothetical protein
VHWKTAFPFTLLYNDFIEITDYLSAGDTLFPLVHKNHPQSKSDNFITPRITRITTAPKTITRNRPFQRHIHITTVTQNYIPVALIYLVVIVHKFLWKNLVACR